MLWIERFTGHLKTINHHKWLVTTTCWKVGLWKQGLLHDLSKYSPTEFIPGVRYWEGGKRSPINKEKELKGGSQGWLHHKGRNRHHFEYWIDYAPNPKDGLIGIKMPKRFVAEMLIDRISASKNYQKEKYTDRSALEYYENGKSHYVMHAETQFLLEYLLKLVADRGEAYALDYVRNVLLKHRFRDYHVKKNRLIL